MEDIFCKLSRSKFRSSFHLSKKDKEYVTNKGLDKIREHAYDFIKKRLAPSQILNDGKQTPMRGHPVFIAQHATGTCCRGCLEKWHHINKNKKMDKNDIDYVVNVIMFWIENEMKNK